MVVPVALALVRAPWYAQIEDPDAWLAAIRRQFARQAGELADDLGGDDRPGEGYLAKAGRLTAARLMAEAIIKHEYGPLTSDDHGGCEDEDEDEDEESRFGERPVVVDRNHPCWAEVDAEQQERIGGPAAD